MDADQKTSAAIDTSRLFGAWELVSWTRTDAAGVVSYPMSDQATGRIIYDPSGVMSGWLMHPDWPGTGPASGHMYLSYSGRFKLVGDVVHHDVEASSDRRFVGEILRRQVIPQGEMVALHTLASAGRDERDSQHRLLWRRTEPS